MTTLDIEIGAATGEATPLLTQDQGGPTGQQENGRQGEPNHLARVLGVLGDITAKGDPLPNPQLQQATSAAQATPLDKEKDQARRARERGTHQEADALLRSLAALFPEPTGKPPAISGPAATQQPVTPVEPNQPKAPAVVI
ncbi:hypothetical protein PCANC_25453 [Puccinia coronata f. sp. avenae]|uniref:Uncharacterized protein n=1 Tax=Puccinia coronata f. sp. avenae TaxID=200324 RepID=A0A2N5S7Q9_9BASI|nr:hypothetical protein PCANC_25453 [Puccinia coronata f. sp. avenae]